MGEVPTRRGAGGTRLTRSSCLRGRAYVMRLWARGARRPQAWWHLGDAASLGLTWPGQDRERSYLYAAGVLTVEERTEVVREWRREFDVACGMGARERREHLAYHDVPAELVTAWEAERKPRRRRARQSDSPTASGSQSMNLNVPTTPSEEAAAIK